VSRRVLKLLQWSGKTAKSFEDAGPVHRRVAHSQEPSGVNPVEVSMDLLSGRALLSVAVVVSITAACASGSARREAGAKNTVTSEDIEKNPSEPVEKLLQAKVPGVWVTRTPDGGIAIQLRGQSSIYGENQPLYVIDGVPINPGPNGALTGINPHDIESIQVLKDPAETAMYGMRGANGVIVVKTKKPGRRG
jgi:TonB-dependent SusC/RagA subfamily outer membrane receptor